VFNQISIGGVSTGSWSNNPFDRFTPFLVGNSDDRYISNNRVARQRVFNVRWIDILGA
jgi:hypothetical protein